ncbi:hypothetical protein J4Q44_G00338450 [Coregonus suidteri]|uniref:COPA/B TPR domain-containing protein n=1 Tax=Coregonus suidteri TaxID=861788 RepID=A0AAN8KP74_9TELE
MADSILPTIPKEMRTRETGETGRGFRQQALAVSTDSEHRFELALQLVELKITYQLAVEAESEQKWKQLAELATTKCQFGLAQDCLHNDQDYGGLLLLATASGNASMVGKLAEGAERDGKTNVAFLTYFLQGKLDKCLELLVKTSRLPEAEHTCPAMCLDYSNLFSGLEEAFLAEDNLKETHVRLRSAAEYPLITPNEDRNVLEESAGYVPKVVQAEPEVVPPGPEPGPADPLAAPLEGKGVEEAAHAAVEVEAASMDLLDLNDKWNDEEGLDDLDLDNFDLDEDTTDLNLDDDFLDD